MNAHLSNISEQGRDMKEDMADSGWQQELCEKAGSHSGICSGNRYAACWLFGLGKIWCPYELWIHRDGRGVPGGLKDRVSGLAQPAAQGALCWQQVLAVPPLRKRDFRGSLCVQVTIWIHAL